MTIQRMGNVGIVVDDLEAARSSWNSAWSWRVRRWSKDVGRPAPSDSTASAARSPEGIMVALAEQLS
jgi:hypothetical protein